jgi:hypothetical protein
MREKEIWKKFFFTIFTLALYHNAQSQYAYFILPIQKWGESGEHK